MHLYNHFIIQATEYIKNFLIIVSASFTYLVILYIYIYIFVYFIFVLIHLLFHLFSQEPSRPPPRLGVNTESFRKFQTLHIRDMVFLDTAYAFRMKTQTC